jgi:hypothetical protein
MLATARAQGSAASRKLTKHQARETLKRVAAGESSAQRAVRRRGLIGGVVRGWFFRRRLGEMNMPVAGPAISAGVNVLRADEIKRTDRDKPRADALSFTGLVGNLRTSAA